MGNRRKARELTVQFLYGFDLNEGDLSQALENFWNILPAKEDIQEFATKLIQGIIEHRDEIDKLIEQYTINWKLDRIAIIDKNVLRMAIYEIVHRDDIPPIVSINEAVDIAKKFSTAESGKFVNGVLDKLRQIIYNTSSSRGGNDRSPHEGSSSGGG